MATKNVKRQHGAQHRAKNAPNSGFRRGLAPCLQAFCWWCWPLWREIRHGRPCTMCCSDFLAVAALCWARQCAALLCSIPGAKTFCPRSSSWFWAGVCLRHGDRFFRYPAAGHVGIPDDSCLLCKRRECMDRRRCAGCTAGRQLLLLCGRPAATLIMIVLALCVSLYILI